MAGVRSVVGKEPAAVRLTTNAYLAVQLINKQMTNYELFFPLWCTAAAE